MTAKSNRNIPANIRPYVEALGADDALKLFLELGGTTVYLPAHRSSVASLIANIVGPEKVLALSERFGHDAAGGYVKVPLARRWTAEVMYLRGTATTEIARKVRADEATVRRWLSEPVKS